MKNSCCPIGRQRQPLRVLLLGGKHEFDERALRYEASRADGNVLLLANCISAAWEILSSSRVDRIIIEAFMENSQNESPFQFLDLLRESQYAQIPVMLVAAEPSALGTSLAPLLARTAHCFGAEFELVRHFEPETVRIRTGKIRKFLC